MITQIGNDFFEGIIDSFKIFSIFDVIVKKEKLRKKIINCFLLNGIVFLGSIAIYHKVIASFGEYLATIFGFEILDNVATYLYYIFWLIPVFLVCNIVTSFWIDEIYFETLECVEESKNIQIEGRDFITTISNLVERLVIVILMMIQIKILNFFPSLSFLRYFTLSILNSLYIFEYILLQKYIKSYKSIMYFIESRFFYFLGFGILFTIIINNISSFTINSAIYLMSFPLFLITSVKVNIIRFKDTRMNSNRLYFFFFIHIFYRIIIGIAYYFISRRKKIAN